MRPPPWDFRILRFWSDTFPADQRLDAWRQILAETLLAADVELLSSQPFQAEAALRILPNYRFGIGIFGPSLSRRTREIVAADNDDLYMMVNMEGPFEIVLGETKTALDEGDACFLSCTQEVSFIRSSVGRLLCLRLERQGLSTLMPHIDEYAGEVIRRGSEPLRLLTTYLRDLDHNQGLATADLRRLIAAHIFDLVALMLRLSRDTAQAKPGVSQSVFRLRAIKKYITDNIGKENMTIATVASAHRLSARQVQRLFEADETTFSEFMLSKRLQNVHAVLTDPRQAHRSVSDIALANGFGDVSYFNRAFRRHFGASPSTIRQSSAAPA